MNIEFPFSAIVGQEDMKLALQIAAIDASIGGVLVLGDRGTGKTTAMRALAALLPPIDVVENCRFACHPEQVDNLCDDCREKAGKGQLTSITRGTPVVDLPLGASEDRVVGALDLEKALTVGVKAFEPGLLAAANRGFLYIDEVNLLEDHLVDLLLDVAVSGVNVVERDGLSVRHAARFLLVGSGNPEEGELRPQLLDRFGLSIDVATPDNIEQRIDIVRLRDEFEQNPEAFVERFLDKDAKIRKQILMAKSMLHDVQVNDAALRTISELCIALGTDGLRGELTMMRACRAYAALCNEKSVDNVHIVRIAAMALRHRLRRDPLDDSASTVRVERAMKSTGLTDG
ncbi:MAG: magnesium chelatase ATPase subunit I [Granulosicoccus sp.]